MINSKYLNATNLFTFATIVCALIIVCVLYFERHINTLGVDIYVISNEKKRYGGKYNWRYSYTARLWINGKLANLETPRPGSSMAYDIVEHDGDIYVAGRFENDACYWKNGKIYILDSGSANKIRVSGDTIHIAGGNQYWKISPEKTDKIILDKIVDISALTVDGDKVYIGGHYKSSGKNSNRIAQVWVIGADTVVFDVVDGTQGLNEGLSEEAIYAKHSRISDIKIIDKKIYISGTTNMYGSAEYWIYDNLTLVRHKVLAERASLVQTTDDGVIANTWNPSRSLLFAWNGQNTILRHYGHTFMSHNDNTYIVGNRKSEFFESLTGYLFINNHRITLKKGQTVGAAIIVPSKK
jgi:hypothetical protein